MDDEFIKFLIKIALLIAAGMAPMILGDKIGSMVAGKIGQMSKNAKKRAWDRSALQRNMQRMGDRADRKRLEKESSGNLFGNKLFGNRRLAERANEGWKRAKETKAGQWAQNRGIVGSSLERTKARNELMKDAETWAEEFSQTEIKNLTMEDPSVLNHDEQRLDPRKVRNLSNEQMYALGMRWAGMDDMEGNTLSMFLNELADRGEWNPAFNVYKEAVSARPNLAGHGEVYNNSGAPELWQSQPNTVAGFLDRYYSSVERPGTSAPTPIDPATGQRTPGGNNPARSSHTLFERMKRAIKKDKIPKLSYTALRARNTVTGEGLTERAQQELVLTRDAAIEMSDKQFESAMGSGGSAGRAVIAEAQRIFAQTGSISRTIEVMDQMAAQQATTGTATNPITGEAYSWNEEIIDPQTHQRIQTGNPDTTMEGFVHWGRWNKATKEALLSRIRRVAPEA